MYEIKNFLTPINVEEDPCHTQIRPRCFTCKKWPVCNIRMDYLKTAQLMQEILGSPQDDFELLPPPFPIPDFEGETVKNPKEYFPKTLISTGGKVGNYYLARYESSKIIKFIYIFGGYFVKFIATFNDKTNEFDVPAGEEICYGLKCIIAENLDDLQLGLLSLKEDLEDPNKEEEKKDIINTTAFSAELNCCFYEWEKGLTYEEGVRRIIAKYPDGVPIGEEGKLYHLATFHRENREVPCYHPENGRAVFMPMPYPVYIPPKCQKRKNLTRDELNEF